MTVIEIEIPDSESESSSEESIPSWHDQICECMHLVCQIINNLLRDLLKILK